MDVDEMRAQLDSDRSSGATKPPEQFRLWTFDELLKRDPPEWLVEGLIETQSLGVLYGPPASGKSFVGLDLSLSIATGRDWHGHGVKQGNVAYVVGEGTSGIVRRVDAWKRHNEVEDVSRAFFLLQVPNLIDVKDVNALVSALTKPLHIPTFIVIDTLARCFVGGDENSAKEMGMFIESCRRLQDATEASLLVIHHSGRPRSKRAPIWERGSTALRAGADVVISVTNNNHVVTLSNEKQKDDRGFESMTFHLKQVELGIDERNDKEQRSCVLVKTDGDAPVRRAANEPNDSERVALKVLSELGVATSGHWHEAISNAKTKAIPDKTFQNWRAALLERYAVGLVAGERNTYEVTEAGRAMLANGTPSTDGKQPTPPERASHATTPLGVAGQHEGGNEEEASDDDETWRRRLQEETAQIKGERL